MSRNPEIAAVVLTICCELRAGRKSDLVPHRLPAFEWCRTSRSLFPEDGLTRAEL
jgi:hypothetical protein